MSLRGRRRLGTLLWVAGVVVATGWAWTSSDPRLRAPGMARGDVFEISAVDTGRIAKVTVELHQDVAVGDIVAELDPTTLLAYREVTAAEFLAISNAGATDPDAYTDAVRKRSSVLQLQTELTILDRKIDSLKDLVAQGAAAQNEVDERLLERKVLTARIQAKLVQNGVDPNDPGVGPGAWAVVAALKQLESVDAELEQLKLRSGIQGRVSSVLRKSGEIVRRGDPILTIASETTNEAFTWVPASRIPAVGSACAVVRADGSRLACSVISSSPTADVLPESLWKLPGRPDRGVTVLVRLAQGSLVPNEALHVLL